MCIRDSAGCGRDALWIRNVVDEFHQDQPLLFDFPEDLLAEKAKEEREKEVMIWAVRKIQARFRGRDGRSEFEAIKKVRHDAWLTTLSDRRLRKTGTYFLVGLCRRESMETQVFGVTFTDDRQVVFCWRALQGWLDTRATTRRRGETRPRPPPTTRWKPRQRRRIPRRGAFFV